MVTIRPTDHTSVSVFMAVYHIFRHCQCLKDLRVRIYDLGTLPNWLKLQNRTEQDA